MEPGGDPLEDWRRRPERSAAGAVLGLVVSWILAFVVVGDWALSTGAGLEPPLPPGAMVLVLLAPVAGLAVACSRPVTRRWQGYVAPGVLAGVLLGYLVVAFVLALAAVA